MEKRAWETNLRHVEIEITSVCNLACPNCDRSAPQARTNERMSLEQIARFVDETKALRWPWKRVTLLGGEPTLHPQFSEIIALLDAARAALPDTSFRLYSNGFGPHVKRRLADLPGWIDVHDTRKSPDVAPLFSAYNVAPIDIGAYLGADFTKGCAITQWCGLGLSRYGYYPCGAGASIDRVFGLDIGIKTLSEVTPAAVRAQLARLCRLCGHFIDFDQRADALEHPDERVETTWVREQRTSATWSHAYEAYALERPMLSLY